MTNLSILPLGACNLAGPLSVAIAENMGFEIAPLATGGITPSVYSFGELLQIIDFLDRKTDIPAELRPLCSFSATYAATQPSLDPDLVDVVLVEPNATVDIEFDGVKINRAGLLGVLTNPAKELVPELAKPINHWYNKGLLTRNEEVREASAQQIVELFPEAFPNRDLMIEVVKGLRGVDSTITEGLSRLVEIFGRKIGLLLYTYQYMPDGRAISWPPDLQNLTEKAAKEFDLPLFRPYEMVAAYGVPKAIRQDTRHYSDEFVPLIAEALVAFAQKVRDGGGYEPPAAKKADAAE